MAPQLAFLGIGLMGQAMTKNIVAKAGLDKPLSIWNRTQARADEHEQNLGSAVRVCSSVKEAVEAAEIVWSCLQDQEAVLETFDEILADDVRGKLFLDSSTILPEVTEEIAERVLQAGAEFVAMPVFGEPGLAEKGGLICVPAGAPESVAKIMPYLVGVVGQSVVDLSGESPGQAALLKIIGNTIILNTMETIAEAHVFAEKSGLGVNPMIKLITTMFPRPPHTIYSGKMTSGDYHAGKAMVEVHKARDLAAHVLSVAKGCNASLKGYEVAVGHLAALEEHAGAHADINGLYGAVRLESGLPFKNDV
ncbi:hypothetical protein MMC25_007614 [Agyrium rufum]|nr:hypothetical protein [Agyrium rufum]